MTASRIFSLPLRWPIMARKEKQSYTFLTGGDKYRLYPPRRVNRSKCQRLGLFDLRQRLHLGEHLRRHRAVDLDQCDGIAARFVAAEMEGRDVDLGIAEQAREVADETGLVLIGDIDHRLAELGVDPDALDIDQPRLAVVIDGAGDRTLLPLRRHRYRDHALIVALRRAGHLVDHHAALLGNHRR